MTGGSYTFVPDTANDTIEVWYQRSGDKNVRTLIDTVRTMAQALEVEDRHKAQQGSDDG